MSGEKKEMKPVLHCRYIPALDFVAALDSAGPRVSRSSGNETSRTVDPVRERILVQESPFRIADLDLVFAPVSTSLFLFYIVIQEDEETPEDLAAYLANLTDAAFLNRARELLHISPEETEWVSPERIEKALVDDRARESVPLEEEALLISRLLRDPSVFRNKLVEILRWFSAGYYAPEREERQQRCEAWLRDNGPGVDAHGREFLNQLTHDCCDTLLQNSAQLFLFPVTRSANSELWVMLPDDAYMVATLDYLQEKMRATPENRDREQDTDLLVETLSDAKRFAILRLLRGKPCYGREIAEHLGVSPSTASYHLEKLMTAQLVRLEISQGRRFYYTLNEQGFEDLLQRLKREFLPPTKAGTC